MSKTRNSGRTKASHEKRWTNIKSRINRYITRRPDDQLATLIADLREIDLGRKSPATFYTTRPLVTDFAKNVMQQNDLKLGNRFFYPDVVNRNYSVGNISVIRYLQGLVRPETCAVVELGSGWSANLFQLYIALGRTVSQNITYIGAEFTKSGKEAARIVADFDGVIQHEEHDFNFTSPNLDFLKQHKKHILVYTRHSVEQIDKIDHRLYQQLFDLDAEVTLVHVEPIGWQRDRDLQVARNSNSADVFDYIGSNLSSSALTEDDQLKNAAWWSWRLNYNYNLSSVMRRYTKEGKVRTVFRAFDFEGDANALNPSSLFHLEFLKNDFEL